MSVLVSGRDASCFFGVGARCDGSWFGADEVEIQAAVTPLFYLTVFDTVEADVA